MQAIWISFQVARKRRDIASKSINFWCVIINKKYNIKIVSFWSAPSVRQATDNITCLIYSKMLYHVNEIVEDDTSHVEQKLFCMVWNLQWIQNCTTTLTSVEPKKITAIFLPPKLPRLSISELLDVICFLSHEPGVFFSYYTLRMLWSDFPEKMINRYSNLYKEQYV